MAEIKKIKVGTAEYELADTYARKRLEGLATVFSIKAGYTYSSSHTFIDWDDETAVAYSSMTILNSKFNSSADAITISASDVTSGTSGYIVLTSTKTTNQYYAKKLTNMVLGDTIYVEEAAPIADRWLSSWTESPLSGTFTALEGKVDLTDYVKVGTRTTAGPSTDATGSAGAATITTTSAGQATASGTATVSYMKADAATGSAGAGSSANTGNAGAATVNGSNFTFTGTAATLTANVSGVSLNNHSYTPAGSITNSYTAAGTTAVLKSVTAALSANPTFTGNQATISLSTSYTPEGTVSGTAVGDHAAQDLTVSGSQSIAAHSHGVNLAKGTVTVVTGVNDAASAGGHNHSIDSHTHAANQTVVTGVTAASLTGTTTFNTDAIKSASCSQSFLTSGLASVTVNSTGTDFVIAPTVNTSTGVLSFNFGGLTTTDATATAVSISTSAASKATVGISGGTASGTVSVAGAFTAATLTTADAGAHTHSVGAKSTSTVTYVTGATLNTAGAATIQGSNFKAALPTLTHTVTDPTFAGTTATISGSTTYTPGGTISKPGITVTPTTVSVNNDAIKAVTSTFTGTAATLAHEFTDGAEGSISIDYTPAGTIGGSQSIAAHSHTYTAPSAHTHSIGSSTATVTGTAAVAVANHTHSVTIASHIHTLGNHTHSVTLNHE